MRTRENETRRHRGHGDQISTVKIIVLLVSFAATGPLSGAEHGEVPTPRSTPAFPLLIGNWADPTILKDGDDYYMTHSSFEFQPGLLLWHSKDLRSWRPLAHAVVNQEGSIWAPDLIKHDGRYYLYYPAAGTNWVVTAKTIAGPWSQPVSIGVGHIDPGHVVGDDGRRYIHLSGGHAVEMSADGLKAATRPQRVYDPQRFRLADGHLALDGRGDTPGNSQPLSVMAMHRAYEIETELSLEGDASAGLMLFGAPGVYIGLALGPDGKLRRVQEGFRRYGGTDEPAIGASRVTLRIVNDQQDVRFYYRVDDGPWEVLQPGMDVSAMTTVGWHTLRPAVFTTGKARGTFERFDYRPLDE